MGHLFKETEDWQHNSINKNKRNEWFHYSLGYLKAAQIIENNLIDNPNDRDFLIHPFIYLHRHYLEIVMKDIIVIANELLNNYGFTPKGGHDLMRLWDESQELLKKFYNDFPKPASIIKEKIKELHNVDIKSDSFRYPISKNGERNLNSLGSINYRNFGNEFREVKDYMEKIVSNLYDAREHIGFIKKTLEQ